MTFSIIVPVYNTGQYLDDCLKSISRQRFSDYELLLIDDGSQDDSGIICDEYARRDDRIKVWHQSNAGVSAARNFGIEHSQGEYIIFVDSDDEMADNSLSVLSENLSCKADVIIFGTTCVSGSTKKSVNPGRGYFDKATFGEKYLDLYRRFIINSPFNKVFKRTILRNGVRFPESMSLGEDLLFCNDYLTKCYSFLCLDEDLYIYKQRTSGSLTTRYYENLFNIYYTHYCSVARTKRHFTPSWDEQECAELYEFYNYYIRQAINMTGHKENTAGFRKRYCQIKDICTHPFTRKCVEHLTTSSVYDCLLKKRRALLLLFYIYASHAKKGIKNIIRT